MEKFTKFLKFAFPLHNKNKKLLYNERGMDMKDFIEWLGVNEKIAKLVVWIFIIFVMLITTNAMLDSIGFPHYQLTYENFKKINLNKILEYFANWLFIILSFYAIVLLVFEVKQAKRLFKYSIIYLICNIAFSLAFTKGIADLFTLLFMLTFSYLYSNKNYKYLVYMVLSLILNTIMQSITYYYKAKFVDYSSLNEFTKGLLFTDYFIIMGIIILVKEIYLKKRSEENGKKLVLDR